MANNAGAKLGGEKGTTQGKDCVGGDDILRGKHASFAVESVCPAPANRTKGQACEGVKLSQTKIQERMGGGEQR